MRVITIASDVEHPFLNQLLIPSCHAVGLELVVLHSGKSPFRPGDKRAVLVEYLRRGTSRDELIVFTDAYDTVFIQGEEFIRNRYADFAQSVVFGAESNCWPLGAVGLALQEAPPTSPYPYLNSGGFIGPAGQILDVCSRYPTPPSGQFKLLQRLRAHGYDTDERFAFSDQYYWTLVHLLEPQTVGLDHQATIFENLAPAIPDVRDMKVVAEWHEFRLRGKDSDGYRRERVRLVKKLQTASHAAQLHFASLITKAVALDLAEEAALPSWLRTSVGSQQARYPNLRVQRV